MDTIFAQSSKPGKAGVSVFRISGFKSLEILKQLTDNKKKIIPRKIYYTKLIHPITKDLIDNAMIVYFKSPASFTGEDIVELHTHGSIAIAEILTDLILKITDVRIAEAGEFTRRAFLNNKFDLTAAEGLSDLIEAETSLQHKQAIRQFNGELEKLYTNWQNSLKTVVSLLEAYIDFPDEEIPIKVIDEVEIIISKLKKEILIHLNDNRKGEILRNGIKLTILGAPNTGKSSLMNFLIQRDISIVSNIAGTTRDIIEGSVNIDGYPFICQDTAGMRRSSRNIIENIGINKALTASKNSDIKIIIFDINTINNLSKIPASLNNIIKLIDDNSIVLINKIDLIPDSNKSNIFYQRLSSLKQEYIEISIKSTLGLQKFLEKLKIKAKNITGNSETVYITRSRQRHHIANTLTYLKNFNLEKDLVLGTEDIRMAMRTLGKITGQIAVEEILEEIFNNFCIGK